MKSLVCVYTVCSVVLISLFIDGAITAPDAVAAMRNKRQSISSVQLKDDSICSDFLERRAYLRNLSIEATSGNYCSTATNPSFVEAMEEVSYLRSGVDTDAYELLCNASACLEPAAAFVRRCYARDYQIQEQLQLFDAMCSVGLNDIPCYEALDESSISWGSCFTTVNNNGALGSCSYLCRRELIEASIDLGCCLKRVYDLPAAARLDYLDSELWSACGVSIPSEGECKFNPQRAAAGEMAGPATAAAILVFTLLALWI